MLGQGLLRALVQLVIHFVHGTRTGLATRNPSLRGNRRGQTELVITLPARWLRAEDIEHLIIGAPVLPHLASGGTVLVRFPRNSAVPASLDLWLLSYLNQIAANGAGAVRLEFADPTGLFGYLGRTGFFDLLDPWVETLPARPSLGAAQQWAGSTPGLVEIQPLDPEKSQLSQQGVVRTLVDGLMAFYPNSAEAQRFGNHAFTVLGELVDNVFGHSQTRLPGYACLQAYDKRRRPRIQISVSDSGIGIPASLRATGDGKLAALPDKELIVRAFRSGLSRHGVHSGRGCGLPKCATLAAKWGGDLDVRTPSALVRLTTARPGQPFHLAEARALPPNLQGTHVTLSFEVTRFGQG